MGGLNKTIHFDFLIKALNKKIRADCLIKENAPNATKPAPPEPPQLAGTPDTRAYSKGPEPLVIQGFGALTYMRSPIHAHAACNSESAVQASNFVATSRRA